MKYVFITLVFASLLAGCYKEDDYSLLNLDPDEVILSIEIADTVLLANGSSSTTITVELPLDAEDDLSTVKFECSKGTFAESESDEMSVVAKLTEVNDTLRRIAEVTFLSSKNDGIATIDISVQNVKKQGIVHLEFNPPNDLNIIPSSLLIHPSQGEEIEIVAQLSSASGGTSTGQVVDVSVLNSSFTSVGTFRIYNSLSNGEGQTNYFYSLAPDSLYIGDLYIVGETSVDGTSIYDTTMIYSVN